MIEKADLTEKVRCYIPRKSSPDIHYFCCDHKLDAMKVYPALLPAQRRQGPPLKPFQDRVDSIMPTSAIIAFGRRTQTQNPFHHSKSSVTGFCTSNLPILVAFAFAQPARRAALGSLAASPALRAWRIASRSVQQASQIREIFFVVCPQCQRQSRSAMRRATS